MVVDAESSLMLREGRIGLDEFILLTSGPTPQIAFDVSRFRKLQEYIIECMDAQFVPQEGRIMADGTLEIKFGSYRK